MLVRMHTARFFCERMRRDVADGVRQHFRVR